MIRTLRPARWSFALAVATSLGFGATQALASPEAAPSLRACDAAACMSSCWNQGYPRGYCTTTGSCVCIRKL